MLRPLVVQGEFPLKWMAMRLAVILFLAELGIMLFLPKLEILTNPWLLLLIDATLLSLVAAPVAHYLVFHPLLASQDKSTATLNMQHIVVLGTVLAKSSVIIFSAEAMIMLILRLVGMPQEGNWVTLIDALILTSVATPAMIFWIAPGMKYGRRSRISRTWPAFLSILIPACLMFFSFIMAFYHSEVENKVQAAESASQHHMAIMRAALANDLTTVTADLLALSRYAQLQRLMTGEVDLAGSLTNDWQAFLLAKDKYSWIQLSDPSGQEVLHKSTHPRYTNSIPFTTLVPDLRPVLRLDHGEIHVFSPRLEVLRQGIDHCQLIFSTPIIPPKPLARGILSLSLSCQKLFKHSLLAVEHHPENIYLLNENDLILFSFGMDDSKLPELTLFANHYPDVARLMDQMGNGQLLRDQGIFTFGSLSLLGLSSNITSPVTPPHQPVHEWRLVTHLPAHSQLKNHSQFRDNMILLAMVVTPLLMVGIWLFVNTVVKWNQAEVNLEEHAHNLEKIIHERTQQLVRADRLTTLGAFTSGMTQEIEDPNSYIAGNVHFLKLYWEKAKGILHRNHQEDDSGRIQQFLPEIDGILDGILTSSQRITRMLISMKSFTRNTPAAMKPELCHLYTPLENALRIMRQDMSKVSLDNQVSHDLVVLCDPQELTQAFVHLLRNGVEATTESKEKSIAISAWVEEKGVCIRFANSGMTIPNEELKTIFDPFAPTTHRTPGMGLSLPIVQGIVVQHGGWIEAIPVAKGTAFQIHLPIPGLPDANVTTAVESPLTS
ncbi:MAG: hypothetical protein G8345_03225 [Magnetococcales bacterium]|nr:hypothetical protein [Magnetococcales bacterium]